MSKLSNLIKSDLSYSKRYGYCYSKPEHKDKLKINAIDTETDRGKPFLFGFYCWNGFKGYETPHDLNDILDIMTQRKYEDCVNVFYNLTYDAEGMLKFFPKSELLKIYFKHNIVVKRTGDRKLIFLDLSDFDTMRKEIENDISYYRISYIPKKYLRIKQGHKSYNYFDLFQYYNTSLEKASTKYLGQHKGDVDRTKISLDRFRSDKKYRAKLIEYCIRDSELTQKLGNLLFQNIYDVYNSKKFISSASIAEDYILHNVKLNLPHLSDEIIKSWLSAYHGGRFEIMKRGKLKDVHEYDLSSAYACEMSRMKMLSKEARCIKVFSEDFTCEYGCYNVDIEIPKDIYIAPLPYYSAKRNQLEFPVGKFKNYWIDKVELEYLAKLGFDYKIHHGFEIFDPDARYDLRDIMVSAYKKKEYYKKLGDDIKANTYKTICNASYGKCIQTIQEKTFEEINDPELINTLAKNEIFFVDDKMYMGVGGTSFRVGNMFSPYYASYITSKIRVKLLKTLDDFYDTTIHAFHTDSVISSKKLRTGIGLGEWELKKTGDLEIYKCGYYKLGDKTRCRGYTYFDPQASSQQKRRIGLGYSIRTQSTDDLNLIVDKDIAFNLSDRKRIWFKMSKNLEDSKPIIIEI